MEYTLILAIGAIISLVFLIPSLILMLSIQKKTKEWRYITSVCFLMILTLAIGTIKYLSSNMIFEIFRNLTIMSASLIFLFGSYKSYKRLKGVKE